MVKDTGLLVHLDGCHISLQSDNLSHQLTVANTHQFIHSRTCHARGRHHCSEQTHRL